MGRFELTGAYALLSQENAKKIGARDTVKNMMKQNENRLRDLNSRQQDISDSIILVQKFSEGIQSDLVSKFEGLLTRGIRQIFGKEYTVSIEFEYTKANNLYADFFMTLPDGKKVSLANGEGGGMRDLVSVLQRILYIVLEPARPAKILFLDENLKALDAGRAPGAFTFMKDLCLELGIQTIFVTHQHAATEIESDGFKVVTIGGQDGE